MEDFLIEVWNDDVRFRFPDPDDDGEDIARDVYTVEVFWRVIFCVGVYYIYSTMKIHRRKEHSDNSHKLEENFFF